MKELYGPGLLLIAVALLAGCGGGGGGGSNTPPPATFTVGGSVAGLSGSGLVLQDNGGADLGVTSSGTFTFMTALASGSAYAVTIKTQPSSPGQTCTVNNGAGTVGSANVTNVAINCVTNVGHFAYAINYGGTVTVYTRNASTGALSVMGSPVAVGIKPFGYAISPDGSLLCVNNGQSGTLSVFSINPSTGALTPVAGSPFDNGATSIPLALTFDPTGAFLYVGNNGTNTIGVYSVNKATGALTALTTLSAGPAFPAFFVWHPNGKFLYVGDGATILPQEQSGHTRSIPTRGN